MKISVSSNYRLTAEAVRLIRALSDVNGISQTAVVEIAVRLMAKRDGVAQEKTGDSKRG
jgi:hypothetical protein